MTLSHWLIPIAMQYMEEDGSVKADPRGVTVQTVSGLTFTPHIPIIESLTHDGETFTGSISQVEVDEYAVYAIASTMSDRHIGFSIIMYHKPTEVWYYCDLLPFDE